MQKGQHVGLKLRGFTFLKLLGAGNFGSVYEVYDQKTNKQCAGKVIPKRLMIEQPKLKQLVQSEITVLKHVNNENVLRYVDSFSTTKEVFIFTEFCNGGDMEHYLKAKKRLSEDEAVEFLQQILNGFLGLHEIGAMHRDFKTANILLHNGVAKIADLGFSKILKDSKLTRTILGTAATMAPELHEGRAYGLECDVWSVGVVYYQLLIGEYPYMGYTDAQILKKIKSYPPRFPENIQISEFSKDFIRQCLTIDPKKRISWTQIYEHPLLDQKKNKQSTLRIGALMSTVNIGKNKDKYKQINPNNHQPLKGTNIEDIKDELSASDRLDKIQQQIKRLDVMQKTIINYSESYLQRRNMIMLTIKYGISLIFELQSLPFNQNLYAFLISKRAYLEIRDFANNLKQRKNFFNFQIYAQEFFNSREYHEIYKQISADFDFIAMYANSFMHEVNTNNPDIKRELTLDVVTSKFNTIYKEQLTSYAFQLYDHKDSKKINTFVLLRLMTFVSDLVKGIMIPPQDYERKMQSLDINQMENNFGRRMHEAYRQINR